MTLNFTGYANDWDEASTPLVLPVPAILLKDQLMAVVQPLTGLPPWAVRWEKDPRPMVSDISRALVTMSLKTSEALGGSDDKRRTIEDDNLTLEVAGQRILTLTLKCEVYDFSAEATTILEQVRTLLHAEFQLDALGLSRISSRLINDLPTTYDNRVVNVAVLEIRLGQVVSFVASKKIGQGWIDTVNTTNVVPGDYS